MILKNYLMRNPNTKGPLEVEEDIQLVEDGVSHGVG